MSEFKDMYNPDFQKYGFSEFDFETSAETTDRENAHRKKDPVVEDIVNRIGKEYIDHISDHD